MTPRQERPDIGDVVASALRAERARAGLRQEDLAALMDWSRPSVSHLESGRRAVTIRDLPPLCRALEVTLPELLGKADPDDLRALGL